LRFLFLTNHRVAFSPHIFPMETHCVSVGWPLWSSATWLLQT
jgi:hypothetical protein